MKLDCNKVYALACSLAVVLAAAGCSETSGGGTQPAAEVWTWGANDKGQLGDGTKDDRTSPAALPIANVVEIKAGLSHTIARKSDGTVWTWGSYGKMSDWPFDCYSGSSTGPYKWVRCFLSPVIVSGLPVIRSIGAGYYHGLAIVESGDSTVCRWGRNNVEQLGATSEFNPGLRLGEDAFGAESRGEIQSLCRPVPDKILQVAGGGGHSLALQSGPPELRVWTWGQNDFKQLGGGSALTCPPSGVACRYAPLPVADLDEVIEIAAGEAHSLALRTDGTVWSWGSDDSGQLGFPAGGPMQEVPVQVKFGATALSPLDHVQAIAAGGAHSLALRQDGTVWAWGRNDLGQMGAERIVFLSSRARQVAGISDVIEIAAGRNFSMALKSDGTVWTWGDGARGQLGTASSEYCPTQFPMGGPVYPCSFSPVQVQGLSGVKHIAAGGNHAAALVAP